MSELERKQLNADDKLTKVMIKLRNIRPFYSAIYESLERVESKTCETMGVDTKHMIYNKEFVEKISFEELLFVNLHEIAHVALMHVSRRKDRDSLLWNLAADLYVNALLADEFELDSGGTNEYYGIRMPKQALFCKSVDLELDCVEDMYDQLYEQAEENGYKDDNIDKLLGEDNTYEFSFKGKNANNNETYKFKVVPKLYWDDIIDSNGNSLQQENDNRRLLMDACTRHQMHGRGTGAGGLEFRVNEILKSHIDWKKLLRRYCIKATSYDSTFSNPDKRMYYQKAIYPGRTTDELNGLKGVKVCFDSSGSISDTDIAYFYGQVHSILKQFKVQAELIYWDTAVASTGDFMNSKELMNITAKGRGGTDPSCLFEYFDSKQCKVKPVVTLIFTDGYVGNAFEQTKWKKRYKDTIWVMTKDYNRGFKPAFGTLTLAKFAD